MSTMSAETIERHRNNPRAEDHACIPLADNICEGDELRGLTLARPHLRVKLCARCPYAPHDVAGHYDPEAAMHLCAKCDADRGLPTSHYPRETQRKRKGTRAAYVSGTSQGSRAPSVTVAFGIPKAVRNRDNPDGRNHPCPPRANALHASDTEGGGT
jgi:hypothetical protein